MSNNLLNNLHGSLPENLRQNSLMQNLGERFNSISAKLSNLQELLAAIPQAVESNYFSLRKRVGAELVSSRKKYRLALESLGWGTLADLLDSAFCGKILNVMA